MAQDVVDDIGDRASGVDADPADGEVFADQVDLQHKFALLGHVAELGGRTDVQASIEGSTSTSGTNTPSNVAGSATRRRRRQRTPAVADECQYLVDVTDVVAMSLLERPPGDRFVDRSAGHRITPTGKHSVSVHDLVSASFELLGYGRLARAGDAVEGIVALSHIRTVERHRPATPPRIVSSDDRPLAS
jgi:hypothetical protein